MSTPDPPPGSGRARVVRPYTLTAGRTQPSVDLPIEATLVVLERPERGLSDTAQRVLAVADRRSVAEVSALVHLPIGVARVLLGDLVEHGAIEVQHTLTEDAPRDERIDLIERTLRGLRSY